MQNESFDFDIITIFFAQVSILVNDGITSYHKWTCHVIQAILLSSWVLNIKKNNYESIEATSFLKLVLQVFYLFFLFIIDQKSFHLKLIYQTPSFLSKWGSMITYYVFRELSNHDFYAFNKVFSYNRKEFLCFDRVCGPFCRFVIKYQEKFNWDP